MSRRRDRFDPITCPYRRWAAWFAGCVSYRGGAYRPPAHPDLAREFFSGADHARQGYVIVADVPAAMELVRHVQAGNPPHSFAERQIGLAL